MPQEFGTVIAVAAVLVFYLRLILLQRHKARRLASQAKSAHRKQKKQSGTDAPFGSSPTRLDIHRPVLVGAGVVIVLIGALAASGAIGSTWQAWWWAVVTLGLVFMGLGIR